MSVTTALPVGPGQPGTARSRRWFGRPEFGAIWIATFALFVVSPLLASGTLSYPALLGMLPFAAVLALASFGQTLVVMQGGLDLSVPGMISLGALIVSKYGSDHGVIPALLVAAVAAAAVGLISGIAVTRFSVTPFVATLAVNALLLAGVLSYSGGQTTQSPESLSAFALDKTLGIPNTIWVALIVLLLLGVVLSKTAEGRRFRLTGANPTAARAAGYRVRTHVVGAYVASALCAAAAGVLAAGFLQTPSLRLGDDYLLSTIAAVVLGGASLAGGRGSVIATAGGALFLSQLTQVVNAMGATRATQFLVQGVIIGLGMSLRAVPWRRLLRSWRPTPNPATAAVHDTPPATPNSSVSGPRPAVPANSPTRTSASHELNVEEK